jgi:hypothetical protein
VHAQLCNMGILHNNAFESSVTLVYPKILSPLQHFQRQHVEASVLRAKKVEVVVQYL